MGNLLAVFGSHAFDTLTSRFQESVVVKVERSQFLTTRQGRRGKLLLSLGSEDEEWIFDSGYHDDTGVFVGTLRLAKHPQYHLEKNGRNLILKRNQTKILRLQDRRVFIIHEDGDEFSLEPFSGRGSGRFLHFRRSDLVFHGENENTIPSTFPLSKFPYAARNAGAVSIGLDHVDGPGVGQQTTFIQQTVVR